MMARKYGRPDEGLHNIIRFKVTDEMEEAIRDAAQANGRTVSEWIRETIEGGLDAELPNKGLLRTAKALIEALGVDK